MGKADATDVGDTERQRRNTHQNQDWLNDGGEHSPSDSLKHGSTWRVSRSKRQKPAHLGEYDRGHDAGVHRPEIESLSVVGTSDRLSILITKIRLEDESIVENGQIAETLGYSVGMNWNPTVS